MKFLDFGREKNYTQNKTASQIGKKQDEKFSKSHLLQGVHKQYHFFFKTFRRLF